MENIQKLSKDRLKIFGNKMDTGSAERIIAKMKRSQDLERDKIDTGPAEKIIAKMKRSQELENLFYYEH